MKKFLSKVVFYLTQKERGATAVEYALIVALVALAIVVGVTALGGGLNTAFTNIAAQVSGVTHRCCSTMGREYRRGISRGVIGSYALSAHPAAWADLITGINTADGSPSRPPGVGKI